MTILVIEDSFFLRRAIQNLLQKCGHTVTSFPDGRAGLRAARATLPNVILLDMMLPGLEGTAVLRQLKKDPLTASIPVVVISSLPQKNEEQLKRDGATAYLEKSALDLDNNSAFLVEAVEKAVRKDLAPAAD